MNQENSMEAEELEPIQTVKYWANAYASPEGDPHFMGHGMAAKLLKEYLKLRQAAEQKSVSDKVTSEIDRLKAANQVLCKSLQEAIQAFDACAKSMRASENALLLCDIRAVGVTV